MQLLIICFTLLSGFVSALLPALPTIIEHNGNYFDDGRGATLFTEQNYQGDSAFAPPDKCVTVADGPSKVRSIIVEPGRICSFFVYPDCPHYAVILRFGEKSNTLGVGVLPLLADNQIRSVHCVLI
ncbi:hypothetical protein CC86DRAFT_386663 [Ophiobolus disseminans]|uniref:Uncharacterized protein n=1 Tax=Ophiobolus disseminans TaxID=1469910 RepID=A0A6A6ZJ42_9PLEO|nr:hypothetical protein CC86DRAFT_386663 [Ophiobolus disseminans]